MILVTRKAAAKRELLFNKPASGLSGHSQDLLQNSFHQNYEKNVV